MWPWGHLAFGYLLFSPAVRLLERRAPRTLPALALALGTQLPDLVDKPLAWVLHVTSSGYGVAHSAFVALPVGLALLALAWWRGRLELGAGLVVGWLSHLVGDVLFAMALRQPYTIERVLWPFVVLPADPADAGALDRVLYYAVNWAEYLAAAESPLVPLLYVGPLLAAAALWLIDGAPGLPRPGWFR